MAGIGKAGVKRPEHLDYTHRRLRDRLGNIAARRRNGADCGDGALTVVRTEAFDNARALIELSQTGGEVGGVALFTGHLFQTAGHLTQSLSPTGGGVCKDGDVIAHVAEVLGYRDAGVYRGFTRRNRHIRGVCDENGALHQRLAVARVLEFGELHKNVGHLVAALAAAYVDNDIDVRPLRQLVLYNGLAGTEGAGDCRGTALCDWEQSVYDTLAAVHGAAGDVFLGVGSGDTDGPALDHGQLVVNALCITNNGDYVCDDVLACVQADDLAGHAVGHHYLVEYGAGLLHGAEHVARNDSVARLCDGDEVPLLLAVERGNVGAAGDGVAGEGAHLGQGALDAVIDIVEHTGAKLNGHRHTGSFNDGAGAKAGGLFINLN